MMVDRDIKCEDCERIVPHNNTSGYVSQWDVKRATTAGWFFKRKGEAWCPDHIPAWVEGWRAKQAQLKEQREILAANAQKKESS